MRRRLALLGSILALLGGILAVGCDGSQQDDAMKAQQKADQEAKEQGIDAGY
ncbi:MAG: hypothetical protein MH204_09735 [Fimbriimonadaceae bacterium]|nr:hypothetical protein [Fimbriimonadaceae bacterium]